MRARMNAGRVNPFTPPAGMVKFMHFDKELGAIKPLPKVHLPPPPKFAQLAPPPPPTEVVPPPGALTHDVEHAGIPTTDLPDPPDKPSIAEKMKLVGVLADKAFFTFTDSALRRANKFPSTVVLSNGEQFESVHLISVEPNSVILEEDGERTTKELERIR